MRSDLPPPLVDATQQPGTDPTLRGELAMGMEGLDAVAPRAVERRPTSVVPVHEYVELRRFKREIRRRAHFHAALRLASACLIAAVFVITFLKDTTETQSKTGFAPRPVAAR